MNFKLPSILILLFISTFQTILPMNSINQKSNVYMNKYYVHRQIQDLRINNDSRIARQNNNVIESVGQNSNTSLEQQKYLKNYYCISCILCCCCPCFSCYFLNQPYKETPVSNSGIPLKTVQTIAELHEIFKDTYDLNIKIAQYNACNSKNPDTHL